MTRCSQNICPPAVPVIRLASAFQVRHAAQLDGRRPVGGGCGLGRHQLPQEATPHLPHQQRTDRTYTLSLQLISRPHYLIHRLTNNN